MSEAEKKYVIGEKLLNAIAMYFQKRPWDEANPFLVAIQKEVDKLPVSKKRTSKEPKKEDQKNEDEDKNKES